MGVPINFTTDIVLFQWQRKSNINIKKSNVINSNTNETKYRAQIFNPYGGLYLLPPTNQINSICKYYNFTSINLIPQELSFQTAKKLTEALHIINPKVSDVRISKFENGLTVILDNEKEVTLSTFGNGAVTWVNTLIAIFELDEHLKAAPLSNIPIIILIDEIVVGIHYSIMSNIWDYLNKYIFQLPIFNLLQQAIAMIALECFVIFSQNMYILATLFVYIKQA